MIQTLEQLIVLQDIDHRLLEIKDVMGDLPLIVESQEKELKELESNNEENSITKNAINTKNIVNQQIFIK